MFRSRLAVLTTAGFLLFLSSYGGAWRVSLLLVYGFLTLTPLAFLRAL